MTMTYFSYEVYIVYFWGLFIFCHKIVFNNVVVMLRPAYEKHVDWIEDY